MASPRTFSVIMTLGISLALLALSVLGTLGPLENLLRLPLNAAQNLTGTTTSDVNSFLDTLAEFQTLRDRNRELEVALASYQSELAELRAYRADYERLAALVNYVGQTGQEWRYVSADVIGRDTSGIVRAIHINAGTRNGVSLGDPVVTELGLVGRVRQVSANGAEVLLISDRNSAVNARVQNATQERGLVRGSVSGEVTLDFVDVNGQLAEGQQVFTSGETQNFPPNLLLGQVQNVRLSSNELFRQATVESLVDFENLEIVLVITNWEPVNVDVFAEPAAEAAAP
ncbi:MAG: rod shape-determining protein MreC [Anaerolineae bacterium]|nr:rod shape-determining protein MreC [Anaerolineae bacterium]